MATLIAIHYGFTSVILCAVMIYLMAWGLFARMRAKHPPAPDTPYSFPQGQL